MKRYLVLALVSFALLTASLFAINPLANSAERYTKQVVVSSVAIYATLRAINAFLSTAQEVEVGGSLVVTGTLQPLKALEPLDDTVERMAGVVFTIAIGSGLLSLAFGPAVGVGFALILLAALARLAVTSGKLDGIAQALLRYGLALGVVVPVAFLLSALLADAMTQKAWQTHEAILLEISDKMERAAPIEEVDALPLKPPAQIGILDSIARRTTALTGSVSRFTDATRATFAGVEDYAQAAQVIVARADDLVISFINILAVFLFKILLLPLILFGVLIAVLRAGLMPSRA